VHGGAASGTVVANGGTEYTQYNSFLTNATVTNGGTEEVNFNGTEYGITLSSGGLGILDDGAIASGGIVFAGTGTVLQIGGTIMPTAVISGFGLNMTIDLRNESFSSSGVALPAGSDLLSVSNIGSGGPLSLVLDHNYAGTTFALSADGFGGTDITITSLPSYTGAPCYRAGTRVRTERGDVPVETLVVGDRVALTDGGFAPVVWLGHRKVDCRRHPRPHDVWPVRVSAGAFGTGAPTRDLFLSPDHAVYADGVLIPIRYLLNDATICQLPADSVTYWHVELPRHGLMLAEGLPCESYLDTGNRGAFANGPAPVMLAPDFALRVWAAEACAQLVTDGAELAAVRSHLLDRAMALGHQTSTDPDLHLRVDGQILRPEISLSRYRFTLPTGASRVHLVSRATAPAHILADNADHRRLGVALTALTLDGQPIPLTDARLARGWHAAESHAPQWRWTEGEAELCGLEGGSLAFDLVLTARYWLRPLPVEAQNLREQQTARG